MKSPNASRHCESCTVGEQSDTQLILYRLDQMEAGQKARDARLDQRFDEEAKERANLLLWVDRLKQRARLQNVVIAAIVPSVIGLALKIFL